MTTDLDDQWLIHHIGAAVQIQLATQTDPPDFREVIRLLVGVALDAWEELHGAEVEAGSAVARIAEKFPDLHTCWRSDLLNGIRRVIANDDPETIERNILVFMLGMLQEEWFAHLSRPGA